MEGGEVASLHTLFIDHRHTELRGRVRFSRFS